VYSAIDNSIFLSIVTSSSGKMEMGPLARTVTSSYSQLSSLFFHRKKKKKKSAGVCLQIVSPSYMDSIGRAHSAFPGASALVKEKGST